MYCEKIIGCVQSCCQRDHSNEERIGNDDALGLPMQYISIKEPVAAVEMLTPQGRQR